MRLLANWLQERAIHPRGYSSDAAAPAKVNTGIEGLGSIAAGQRHMRHVSAGSCGVDGDIRRQRDITHRSGRPV